MKRRTFLMGAAAGYVSRITRGAGKSPNILILMTDQQSWDVMSCRLGSRYLQTPHMNSLAASGAVFTRAYCANPLCVPSRTSMFTGRYPPETGVLTNDTTPIDHQRFPTRGSVFQNAEYSTAYFGKWHLPYREGRPETHGFQTVNPGRLKGDTAVAEAAARFLREKPREPFLAVVSFVNPRGPFGGRITPRSRPRNGYSANARRGASGCRVRTLSEWAGPRRRRVVSAGAGGSDHPGRPFRAIRKVPSTSGKGPLD